MAKARKRNYWWLINDREGYCLWYGPEAPISFDAIGEDGGTVCVFEDSKDPSLLEALKPRKLKVGECVKIRLKKAEII